MTSIPNDKSTVANGHRSGSLALEEPWFEQDVSKRFSPDIPWPAAGDQSAGASPTAVACSLALFTALILDSVAITPLFGNRVAALAILAPVIDHKLSRAQEAIALLDQWLNDESDYDIRVWPDVKAALERDRLSNRRLFDA